MKNTLSVKVGVGMVVAAFLSVPLSVQAQYSPPPGYEGMTPPPGYENMMPPNGGAMPYPGMMPSDGQMGPPADMQERMKSSLEHLKRNLRMMQRAVKAMEKTVAGVQKAGASVPAEVTAAIEKAKAAIQTIQNAAGMDESVQAALEDFTDFTEVLDANIENMMLLTRFPKVLKAAERSLSRLTRFFETTQSRLANVNIDISSMVAEVRVKVDALKAVFDKAQALAKEGKPQDAFDQLENEFFPMLEDVSQSIGLLSAVKGISKAARNVERGIRTAEKIIARLVREGIEAAPAQAIVDEARARFTDFRAYTAKPGFDLETAMEYLEDLDQLREDFMSRVDELVGDEDVGRLPTVKFFNGGANMPMPMEMRQGYEGFRDQTMRQGGMRGNGSPSDSFGVGPEMMQPYGAPEGFEY